MKEWFKSLSVNDIAQFIFLLPILALAVWGIIFTLIFIVGIFGWWSPLLFIWAAAAFWLFFIGN